MTNSEVYPTRWLIPKMVQHDHHGDIPLKSTPMLKHVYRVTRGHTPMVVGYNVHDPLYSF